MKKLFFGFAALALVSLGSCKKDYVCKCSNGISATYTDTKANAETSCDAYEVVQNSGIGTGVTCNIVD